MIVTPTTHTAGHELSSEGMVRLIAGMAELAAMFKEVAEAVDEVPIKLATTSRLPAIVDERRCSMNTYNFQYFTSFLDWFLGWDSTSDPIQESAHHSAVLYALVATLLEEGDINITGRDDVSVAEAVQRALHRIKERM